MKIKYKHGDEYAILFVILTTVFYTIQGSYLFFPQMKILLALAFVMSFFGILKKINISRSYINIKFIICIICVLISFLKTSDTRLLISLLSIILGSKYDINELIKTMFWSKLISFGLVMLFGGYFHINGCALHGGMLILIYLACLGNRLNFNNMIKCLLFYIILSLYTHSGSIIICCGFAITMLTLKRIRLFKRIIFSRFTTYSFVICLVLNIVSAQLFYKDLPLAISNFLRILDSFVSHRIELAAYSLMKYGVSYFGGNVQFDLLNNNGIGYFTIDSGYIWLLQGTGLIITLLFMISTVFVLSYFVKTKNYTLLVIAITISLWGMNEDMLISLGMNFLYYYFGYAISQMILFREEKLKYEYS